MGARYGPLTSTMGSLPESYDYCCFYCCCCSMLISLFLLSFLSTDIVIRRFRVWGLGFEGLGFRVKIDFFLCFLCFALVCFSHLLLCFFLFRICFTFTKPFYCKLPQRGPYLSETLKCLREELAKMASGV